MSEIKRLAILWAPWRMKYIESPKKETCIFCIGEDKEKDRKNLIVYRGSKSFIIMNRYPYNTGHVMIAPYKHVGDLTLLTDEELLDLMKNVNLSIRILREALKPEGFNIGINMGKVAGAGVEDHVHVHVVPRWLGDTNFMPVISQIKVMPELLETTYDKLREALSKLIERG
ncbi:MAG: HIT family protein [Candidatus Nezhaarchaeales archaeon]